MRISEPDLLAALPRLRRYARSLARDPGEAEDLLHDCVEKGLSRADTWRGENLPGWLMTVMTNLYRNRGRRDRGAAERLDIDAVEPAAVEAPADPLERARLAAAIDRLSPDNRAVLMLVVVEGYTYAEVAATLDVPIGTVMSRLSRSRTALAEMLRGHNILAFSRP